MSKPMPKLMDTSIYIYIYIHTHRYIYICTCKLLMFFCGNTNCDFGITFPMCPRQTHSQKIPWFSWDWICKNKHRYIIWNNDYRTHTHTHARTHAQNHRHRPTQRKVQKVFYDCAAGDIRWILSVEYWCLANLTSCLISFYLSSVFSLGWGVHTPCTQAHLAKMDIYPNAGSSTWLQW